MSVIGTITITFDNLTTAHFTTNIIPLYFTQFTGVGQISPIIMYDVVDSTSEQNPIYSRWTAFYQQDNSVNPPIYNWIGTAYASAISTGLVDYEVIDAFYYDETGAVKHERVSNTGNLTKTITLSTPGTNSTINLMSTYSGNVNINGTDYKGMQDNIPVISGVNFVTLNIQNGSITIANLGNMESIRYNDTVYNSFPVIINNIPITQYTKIQLLAKGKASSPTITVDYTNTKEPVVTNTTNALDPPQHN